MVLASASICAGFSLVLPAASHAERAAARAARADAAGASRPPVSAVPRAPDVAPLPTATPQQGEAAEVTGPASPAGEADPLVSNGLGSPSCQRGLADELTPNARRDCETSGFVASAAPTGNYGLDVHIDTGVLGLSAGGLLSAVQDLLIAPIWLAIVWIVHALVVMLEWCFTVDLLQGDAGLGAGLAGAERYLTGPWLPLALAIAAVALAYDGLIRRRVADSLGQAVLVVAMICGGLWLVVNPLGTVGALSGWANEAGLGTLAVAVRGTPSGPGEALGVAMSGIFEATVEGPWCYLEFGNVRWCRDTAELSPGLRQAGLKIAGEESSKAGAAGAADARSARLLREARTNGGLFLALPTNGPQRNSINDEGSLLRTMCGSSEATNCSGPAAAEAEFRTNSGTWPRVGGLLLIAIGVVGMLLLLGHIGLRLLMAAMLSLFYLLLAPGVVLVPALGERGRAMFRAWAGRLFGAVLSKLVFAFLLGVVLAVMAVLESLSLGWWTQWLLMAAFWWGVYFRRHQLLGGGAGFLPGVAQYQRRPIKRRAEDLIERSLTRRIGESRRAPGGERERPTPPSSAGAAAPAPARTPDAQALALLTREGGARQPVDRETHPPDPREAQIERIARGRREALAAGDLKRAARLGARRRRVGEELDRDGQAATSARQSNGRDPAERLKRARAHAAFLDAQAALPARGARDPAGRRRAYAAMAPLAGVTRAEYERLAPGPQRAARLEIDRELAARREGPVRDLPAPAARAEGHRVPVRRDASEGGPGDSGRPRLPVRGDRPGQEPESDVMRDIREVEAGRKRQLGIGRP